eukprot:TRINITY_DN15644_c0_g1_i1.p1 TRINITY_DN15644_c0_g1~~TRINITY_DN15644_c0_g1_i1.p1  ORF type:complete len:139 (+),score=26.97 TRINITY_DN15644_c0_g1_i1:236-652(+)
MSNDVKETRKQQRAVPVEYLFVEIRVTFDEADSATSSSTIELDAYTVKNLVIAAIRTLFGQHGLGAHPVDVLSCDEKSGTSLLRLPSSSLVSVRSALSLLGSFGEKRCRVDVLRVRSSLVAMSNDCREWMESLLLLTP